MPINDEMIIIPRGHSTVGVGPSVYAIIEQDDEKGFKYGPVKKMTDATIDVNISPKAESAQQWADDGVAEDVSLLGAIDIAIEMNDIPPEVQEDWFGHQRDGNGVLLKHANDNAPYIAFGFRSQMSNKKYAYKWLLRAKPQMFEESFHTHEGGAPKYTTRKVNLNGEKRKYDEYWQFGVREDQEGVSSEVIKDWFKKVYEPVPVAAP